MLFLKSLKAMGFALSQLSDTFYVVSCQDCVVLCADSERNILLCTGLMYLTQVSHNKSCIKW
jgi:hypothetical protein